MWDSNTPAMIARSLGGGIRNCCSLGAATAAVYVVTYSIIMMLHEEVKPYG